MKGFWTTKKLIVFLVALLILLALILIMTQFLILRRAHSTFENYFAFRGCSQLLERTDTYGLCRLTSGQVIKIVEYQGRWFLNNDLPSCRLGVCL